MYSDISKLSPANNNSNCEISQCNSVKVSYGGKAINANVLASDKTNDLAILKSNIKPKVNNFKLRLNNSYIYS